MSGRIAGAQYALPFRYGRRYNRVYIYPVFQKRAGYYKGTLICPGSYGYYRSYALSAGYAQPLKACSHVIAVLKQPFAACRMHPPLSRAPSLTETARRIGSSRVYAMRSSSAADLYSKCRIISAAFLRMMMHVDCKWPSLMISKVLSLGLKTSRRQPTGWNRSALRSGTHSV